MSFARNLRAARQAKGLTQEELALACGWRGQSRVANYESRGQNAREPSEADIRILAKVLDVPVSRLFGEYPEAQATAPHAAREPGEHVEIPVYDLRVAAGNGWVNFDAPPEGRLLFQRKWLYRKGIKAKTSVVGYVRGDSMLPRLRDGDSILFDTTDKSVRPGKVYVLRRGDDVFVKRLFPEGHRLRVSSDNKADPQWADWYIDPTDTDFEIVGRVRWVGSWED